MFADGKYPFPRQVVSRHCSNSFPLCNLNCAFLNAVCRSCASHPGSQLNLPLNIDLILPVGRRKKKKLAPVMELGDLDVAFCTRRGHCLPTHSFLKTSLSLVTSLLGSFPAPHLSWEFAHTGSCTSMSSICYVEMCTISRVIKPDHSPF